MKAKLKITYIILFASVLYSCNPYNKLLTPIYEQAGSNKKELQKVVRHYAVHRRDTLKLKATLFLLQNMDAHFSYKGKGWDKFCQHLDSVFHKETNVGAQNFAFNYVFRNYGDTLENGLQKIPDLQVVNSAYLIKNIDQAFEAWKSPYARHLNFGEFCEYLLPYKVSDSPVEEWRDLYRDDFVAPILKKKKMELGKSSNIEICTALKNDISLALYYYPVGIPDFGARLLEKLRVGTCRDYSYMAIYAGRSIGLPVAMDYTPQWAKRSMGHEWNSLYGYDKKSLDFAFGSLPVLGEHLNTKTNVNWIAPKVYRLTYAKQPNSLAMIHGNEEIPYLFESPCFKDVSGEYFPGADLNIELNQPSPHNNRFSYLAVFDNRDWIPVAWAEVKNKKALFTTMNRGAVYLPVYYCNDYISPAAYPVLVRESGRQEILKPDVKHKQTIVVERKYTDAHLMYFSKPKAGGQFQFSNDSLFSQYVDAYVTPDSVKIRYNTIDVSLDKPYRYFRYKGPKDSNGEMAEIELYEAGNPQKLSGKLSGNGHTPKGKEISKAFDGDPLTYYHAFESWNGWVAMQFDSPRQISKLVYLPRNDDNFIRDGELYELFYWDNGWYSLGRQTGNKQTYSLTYKNVPTNALFLLRNLTKGHEERIFTYEDGKQVWW